MTRPTDWSPVDMDSDPTPGDPEEVRALADELQTFSDDVDEALGKIRALASDRAVRDWAGLSAEAFRDEFDGVPGNLEKLRDSYDLCAQALNTYWPKLQTAQGQADRALDHAIAAQTDLTAAQGSLGAAQHDLGDRRIAGQEPGRGRHPSPLSRPVRRPRDRVARQLPPALRPVDRPLRHPRPARAGGAPCARSEAASPAPPAGP